MHNVIFTTLSELLFLYWSLFYENCLQIAIKGKIKVVLRLTLFFASYFVVYDYLHSVLAFNLFLSMSKRYTNLIVLRLMMSLKQSWNKCFNLSWIKGHLMLLDYIPMVLSRGKRKYYLIHGCHNSIGVMLFCFVKPYFTFLSCSLICSCTIVCWVLSFFQNDVLGFCFKAGCFWWITCKHF